VICRFGAEALFKEDDQTVEDKSKALYEDSIDAIRARAEVRRAYFVGANIWDCLSTPLPLLLGRAPAGHVQVCNEAPTRSPAST
jgi:hypothetical protein